MPRSFSFPDVKDRSANSPIFLTSPEQVLGNYNQNNPKNKQSIITQEVKDWFVKKALVAWKQAKFLGNQCLLSAISDPLL